MESKTICRLLILIVVSGIICCCQSFGNAIFEANCYVHQIKTDTLGIPIKAAKFDTLVNTLLGKFRTTDSSKSIDDYLSLVRVVNTIEFEDLEHKNENYDELSNLFFKKCLETTIKVTDAKISIGLGYYSKKYDIQIGGRKTRNNFYKIM
jgi:hypothetical protein